MDTRVANLIVMLFIVVSIIFTFNIQIQIQSKVEQFEQDKENIMKEIKEQGDRIENIGDRLEKIDDELEYQKEEYNKIIDILDIQEFSTTMYAPLDPEAVEGGCFEGDRNITASGEEVRLYETVASGEDIEFGTKIYLEDFGLLEVNDRGGAIGEGDIDIAVESLEEAQKWGRRERAGIIIKQ